MSIPQALGIQCKLFDQGICGAKGMVNQWLRVPCGVISNVWSFQLFSSQCGISESMVFLCTNLKIASFAGSQTWQLSIHSTWRLMRKSTNWWMFKPWSWLLGGKVKQMMTILWIRGLPMTILWIRGLPPFPAWSRSCSAKRSWTLRASVSCSSRAFSA